MNDVMLLLLMSAIPVFVGCMIVTTWFEREDVTRVLGDVATLIIVGAVAAVLTSNGFVWLVLIGLMIQLMGVRLMLASARMRQRERAR